MQVSGTTLRTEDTSGGVALVFLTSGDVSELRTRVRHLADMHNRMQGGSRSNNMQQGGATNAPPSSSMPGTGMYDTQGSGAPGGGSMGTDKHLRRRFDGMQQPSTQGGAHGMMPSSTARAEDIDGGAQLILIATDPSQTDALRQSAREASAGHGRRQLLDDDAGRHQQGGMQQNQMQQKQMPQNQMPAEPAMPPNGMQNEPGGY